MMTLKEFKRIKKVAGLSFCLQAHCSFRAKSDLCMNARRTQSMKLSIDQNRYQSISIDNS